MENGLLMPIQKMLQVAKKYSMVFHLLALENNLKRPAWYYIGLAQEKYLRINTASMLCLRQNHQIHMVGDMTKLSKTLGIKAPQSHKARKNCACTVCKKLQRKGCSYSHKCSKIAKDYIVRLGKKWNPNSPEVD